MITSAVPWRPGAVLAARMASASQGSPVSPGSAAVRSVLGAVKWSLNRCAFKPHSPKPADQILIGEFR